MSILHKCPYPKTPLRWPAKCETLCIKTCSTFEKTKTPVLNMTYASDISNFEPDFFGHCGMLSTYVETAMQFKSPFLRWYIFLSILDLPLFLAASHSNHVSYTALQNCHCISLFGNTKEVISLLRIISHMLVINSSCCHCHFLPRACGM